jgi:hypothetical protein
VRGSELILIGSGGTLYWTVVTPTCRLFECDHADIAM